jgi:hemoglobin/transferrin/lactoferrin receptor protein
VSALTWAKGGNWGVRLAATTFGRQERVDQAAILALWDGRGGRPVQFVPAGATIWDLSAYASLGRHVRLSAGVFNLTDRQYWFWQDVRDLDRARVDLQRFAQPGRNVRVSATVIF